MNTMSYILLDVIKEMRILQPGSMIQVSKKSPDKFITRLLILSDRFRTAIMFQHRSNRTENLEAGRGIVDARNGGASGCVETGAFGTEAYWLAGYFNLQST